MFGFRHGGRRRGGMRGNRQGGRQMNPQRGQCIAHFQQTGEWPSWSRRAGGPGYWRRMASQVPPAPQSENATPSDQE